MKKTIACILFVILFSAMCFVGCDNKRIVDTFDESLLSSYEYVLNEDKNGVGNIPFDEYLLDQQIPEGVETVYLSQKARRSKTAELSTSAISE